MRLEIALLTALVTSSCSLLFEDAEPGGVEGRIFDYLQYDEPGVHRLELTAPRGRDGLLILGIGASWASALEDLDVFFNGENMERVIHRGGASIDGLPDLSTALYTHQIEEGASGDLVEIVVRNPDRFANHMAVLGVVVSDGEPGLQTGDFGESASASLDLDEKESVAVWLVRTTSSTITLLGGEKLMEVKAGMDDSSGLHLLMSHHEEGDLLEVIIEDEDWVAVAVGI